MRAFANLPGYDIRTRIGRGAGAVIYEGIERATRRQVAIKHTVRKGPQDDRFLEQCSNEYEVGRKFDHPMLRKVYVLKAVRKWLKVRELFLVMEYVDGVRLEERFPADQPRDLIKLVNLFIKVTDALAAMHKGGIVHADVKPNNIMVMADSSIKLIDFGQSCPVGFTKQRVQGTPDYIAPEQVQRNPLDQRTDIYNLGATMYSTFTGKWLRTALPAGAVGEKKLSLDAERSNVPPHELVADIPLPLSRLIMDCCEQDKDSRPWDTAKVRSRLETVVHVLERRAAGMGQPSTEPD
ncbi:MAG: serine/threonine protein kinase [Phycisphaerales bacterium]|nr:serine/threonine protein kinase [Phycisphaerales bacterium]